MMFPVIRCLHCGNCASRESIGHCDRCLCDVCPTTLSRRYYRQGSRGPYDLKVRRVCRIKEENGKGGTYVAEVGSKCPHSHVSQTGRPNLLLDPKLVPLTMPIWKAEKKTVLDRETLNYVISEGGKEFEDWQPLLDEMSP